MYTDCLTVCAGIAVQKIFVIEKRNGGYCYDRPKVTELSKKSASVSISV